MYHHHSQQQGSQPFASGPRPPHHRPPPNEHQSHPASGMMSSTGFPFPRPTQLPDELESALAIHGVRDMDHRLVDIMNQSSQHENQSSASRVPQHGNYTSSARGLASEDPQGIEWSAYQPPTKLFASPPPSGTHQPQRLQAPHQQPQSSHAVSNMPRWAGDPPPQARRSGGDGQGLYTPESAGSILASFGLSNEDLEVLSHYPDDQLTPDTLPFILRDIQISKSGNKKPVGIGSAPPFPRNDRPLPSSRSPPLTRPLSPNVPSLLTVTQTAGKVIDYGHASRATTETTGPDTFKREQLSSERTVKMYPSSSSSSSVPKKDIMDRRQVRLEHTASSKYGDQDYRRAGNDHRKSNRSPGREFPLQTKSRYEDIDYRPSGAKFRSSAETTSEASSRRPPSSSYKKMPTPTMISDFSANTPKVYPHTCSLCHIQCDQEKDWVDHVNTVNHTAACRDLRNKYVDWKPDLPSRSGRYGSRALWDPPRSSSGSRSLSHSPSPPRGRRISDPHPHRGQGKPYSPHGHPGHHPYTGSSHRPLKRPREDSPKFPSASSRHTASSKHGPPHSATKTVKTPKTVTKTAKTANTKAAAPSTKPTMVKKKKKVVSQSPQVSKIAQRLVYLTGIPHDATEQEVTDLVGSFGKIKNILLMPCSEEEIEKGEGQKASVHMVKAEDAQTLAASTNLSIRDQQITALISQKPSAENPSPAKTSTPNPEPEKTVAVENPSKETTEEITKETIKETTKEATEEITEETVKETPKEITEEVTKETTEKSTKEATKETTKPVTKNETKAKAVQKAVQKPVQKPLQKAVKKASTEKASVLITGLPNSDWVESDIVSLVEPFGVPSEVIVATQIGKALVLMPDTEIAQEMVKLNTLTPMQLKDCDLSMTQLKQPIGLSTPVALYNLLMGSENSPPAVWSSLLQINNVPSTPSGPSEVEKLVRRFGTIVKTLALNNMLICEMATAAMAQSVSKRFQTFPCIIHNNPLYFSRKMDPKTGTQSKVAAKKPEPHKETAAAKGKAVQPAAPKDKAASGPPSEEVKKADEVKDEPVESMEQSVGAVEALNENGSKGDDIKKEEPVTDSAAAPDAQPEAQLEMKTPETLETATVTEAVEEEKSVGEPKAENDQTCADEEAKPCISEVSPEKPEEELPKLTQEMVNTLLVECRTQTNSGAASTNGDKEETQTETDHGKKPSEKAKATAKNNADQEAKKQERERKEREARKEKERERKERERKAWEKERAKREKEREERARERERREQERKEWERKDRARRERKRPHGEDLSGSRWSGRSRRDESHSEAEEMDCDEFPFNLSDFVTVDEVGEVADLPCHPPSPETMEDAATSIQADASEDTPTTVTTEAAMSEATSTPVQSEPTPDSDAVTVATAEKSDGLVTSDLTPGSQTSQSESSQSQTDVPVCQPEAPEPSKTESAAADTPQSTPQVEPIATPAPEDSSDPADCSEQAEEKQQEEEKKEEENQQEEEKKREEEKRLQEEKRLEEERQMEEEKRLKEEKQKEEEKRMEEEKQKAEKQQQKVKEEETDAPAKDTENLQKCEDQTNKEKEESVKEETPLSTSDSLPPYNPSNPVGMEFLVPKTGFFCKPCNRFFTGVKEAEISHCKTLKHYDNLQKFLQTMKTVSSKPGGC